MYSIYRRPDGSTDDLLSKSQAVFNMLTPLSAYFHKLCTCDKEKTYCSYKQYTECKTNIRGREYHCVLHSSSRRKRDLDFLTRFQGTYPTLEVHEVSFSECMVFSVFKLHSNIFLYFPIYYVLPFFDDDILQHRRNKRTPLI